MDALGEESFQDRAPLIEYEFFLCSLNNKSCFRLTFIQSFLNGQKTRTSLASSIDVVDVIDLGVKRLSGPGDQYRSIKVTVS